MRRLERQEANLPFPLSRVARKGEHDQILDGLAYGQVGVDLEQSWHGLTASDPFIGVVGHRGDVVRHYDALLVCRPLEDDRVLGLVESLYVLGPYDVEPGNTSLETSHNPAIEILIGEKGGAWAC